MPVHGIVWLNSTEASATSTAMMSMSTPLKPMKTYRPESAEIAMASVMYPDVRPGMMPTELWVPVVGSIETRW